MTKYLHKERYFSKDSKYVFQTNIHHKYAIMWFSPQVPDKYIIFKLIMDAKLYLNVILNNLYLSV